MANSVDPDQMPQSVASDLGLHCLQRPIGPNFFRKNEKNIGPNFFRKNEKKKQKNNKN